MIDSIHPLYLFDTTINLIYWVIIYVLWSPRSLIWKLGLFDFIILFYSFVITLAIIQFANYKNIYFYYVSNLLTRPFFFWHKDHKMVWKTLIILKSWYLLYPLHYLFSFLLQIDFHPALIIIPNSIYYSITFHFKFLFNTCPSHVCICICWQQKPRLTLTNIFLNS